MEVLTFNTTEIALLTATSLLFIIQILYYLCLYSRIYRHNRATKQGEVHFSQELPPISVIISTRDEPENLRRNLTSILEQDYPEFEVIVINDRNTNDSEDYLTLLEEKYPHLYHTYIPESSRYLSRKKLALTLGIKASKHDWLVFTDVSCMPQSNQWLRLMARNFTSRTQVVLGYSGYENSKGWLHRRVALDNLFLSMRYLGFALAGSPYMGIGRNMAYRKELFFQQKGYSAHLNLQRGDDDLFINTIANSENTRVETDANAIVLKCPVFRAKDWREEKIIYASTARLYKGIQPKLAGFETLTRLLFYIGWIAALVFGILNSHWQTITVASLAWILRFAVQAFIINKTAKDLNDKRRYYLTLPIFDLVQLTQSLHWKLYCIFRKKSDFLRR